MISHDSPVLSRIKEYLGEGLAWKAMGFHKYLTANFTSDNFSAGHENRCTDDLYCIHAAAFLPTGIIF